MTGRWRWLILPVVAVPLVWILFTGFGRDPREVPSPLIGRPMPEFRLTAIDGTEVSSESLRGRPVLVNFWASWCIPACVDEHPVLLEAQERYGDQLAVVGILYDDGPSTARAFLDRYGDGGWSHLLDPNGRMAIEFGVTGPPESFLIDADGTIRFKHSGPLTTEILDAEIAAILSPDNDGDEGADQ